MVWHQGKLDDAEQLLSKVVGIQRRSLGESHSSTLNTMGNLASVLRKAGRQGEAIPLHRQVLEAQRRTLGDQHPSTLETIANLASAQGEESEGEDPIQQLPDTLTADPSEQTERTQAMAVLEQSLRTLPLRQQQAFLLRAWEGFDVAETAQAMGCSEGSVKTHYSRAVHSLRKHLEEFEP